MKRKEKKKMKCTREETYSRLVSIHPQDGRQSDSDVWGHSWIKQDPKNVDARVLRYKDVGGIILDYPAVTVKTFEEEATTSGMTNEESCVIAKKFLEANKDWFMVNNLSMNLSAALDRIAKTHINEVLEVFSLEMDTEPVVVFQMLQSELEDFKKQVLDRPTNK